LRPQVYSLVIFSLPRKVTTRKTVCVRTAITSLLYDGRTHWRRLNGIYDMRVTIACPDYKAMFDRWTGVRLYAVPTTKRPH